MFKQVKSIIFWTLLYKFRKRVSVVAILIAMIMFAQWIYSDVVEYLKLTEQLTYLNYILPAKWIMIFVNLGVSIYLILTIFKPDSKDNEKIKSKKKEKTTLNRVVKTSATPKEKFTDREKELLNKKLRSKAEILMDS